jgi:hypothetical protein
MLVKTNKYPMPVFSPKLISDRKLGRINRWQHCHRKCPVIFHHSPRQSVSVQADDLCTSLGRTSPDKSEDSEEPESLTANA